MEVENELEVEVEVETGGQPDVEIKEETNRVVTELETSARGEDGESDRGVEMEIDIETGSQQLEVEIEKVTERVVTADVLAVFFTRRNRKGEGLIENTEVVGKRLRVSSTYLSSPYTTGVKKRTFIDRSKIDLFQKVDLSKEAKFFKRYSKLGIW
ncbi:hypothetical protein Adt_45314 [Abeliophyllum distichum]|uniref:Uncharacterized protein n=1 Tax=Abeliophyllum distichum TaxID=126358 RepID=A0ABD1PE44_9LAMI